MIKNRFLKLAAILALTLIESVAGIVLGFELGDNSLSLVANLVSELAPDDPKVYRRAILEGDAASISDEKWQSLLLYEGKRYYQEAVLFRIDQNVELSFEFDDNNLNFSVALTDYVNHQSHQEYVYQNLVFQNDVSASCLSKGHIIIPSTIAIQIWQACFDGLDYSPNLLCGKNLLVNGTPKIIGAIYDVNANRQATNNFWYRNFGDTVFLAANEFRETAPSGSAKYYFTVNNEIDCSITIASAFLLFCRTLSVPNFSDNQAIQQEGVNIYSLEEQIKEMPSQPGSIALAIVALGFELASIVLNICILRKEKQNRSFLCLVSCAAIIVCSIALFGISTRALQYVVINGISFFITTRATVWILLGVSLLLSTPAIAVLFSKCNEANVHSAIKSHKFNMVTRYVKV